MRFIDLDLARRVEMAEANAGRECAEACHRLHPDYPVAVQEIAGGIAVFAGVDSPVTQAIGVGLHGPVSDAGLEMEFRNARTRCGGRGRAHSFIGAGASNFSQPDRNFYVALPRFCNSPFLSSSLRPLRPCASRRSSISDFSPLFLCVRCGKAFDFLTCVASTLSCGPARHPNRRCHQIVAGGNFVDQAPPQGLFCANSSASDKHLQRAPAPN